MSRTYLSSQVLVHGGTVVGLVGDAVVNSQRRGRRTVATSPAYLRALRQAELAAWEAQPPIVRPADPFRSARTELRKQRRSEGWLFATVTLIGTAALLFAFRESLRLPEHWGEFTALVQKMVG